MVPLAPDLGPTPAYTKNLTGQVATKFEDGRCEYIGALPDNWESFHLMGSEEEVVTVSDDLMQES